MARVINSSWFCNKSFVFSIGCDKLVLKGIISFICNYLDAFSREWYVKSLNCIISVDEKHVKIKPKAILCNSVGDLVKMDYDYLQQLFSGGGFATIKNWLFSSMFTESKRWRHQNLSLNRWLNNTPLLLWSCPSPKLLTVKI